jgi:hypothetical protein
VQWHNGPPISAHMHYLARRVGPPILNLVCQGAGGLGGQDWDGPHLVVGRLVLGHTAHQPHHPSQPVMRYLILAIGRGASRTRCRRGLGFRAL